LLTKGEVWNTNQSILDFRFWIEAETRNKAGTVEGAEERGDAQKKKKSWNTNDANCTNDTNMDKSDETTGAHGEARGGTVFRFPLRPLRLRGEKSVSGCLSFVVPKSV